MRNIDEDNITQAVIARHASAANARMREVTTSLVQHLHAFARDVKLTEEEWLLGLRFLGECGRASVGARQELQLLSDTLGLSMLVTAQNHRKPRGCTDATPAGARAGAAADSGGPAAEGPACHVRGRVRAADGRPVAGAEIRVWPVGAEGQPAGKTAGASAPPARVGIVSGADGEFLCKAVLAGPHSVPHDGPVGLLLAALGRHPWRPAHLRFMINAPGYESLVTDVFRAEDPYLDSDAVFGVRASLVADWVRHPPGRTPDGQTSAQPFYTLDFAFVLNPTTGDKP